MNSEQDGGQHALDRHHLQDQLDQLFDSTTVMMFL